MYSRSNQPIKTFEGFVELLKELGYVSQTPRPMAERHREEQTI